MSNLTTEIADELTKLTAQLPRLEASMVRRIQRAFQKFQGDVLAEIQKAGITDVAAIRYREQRMLALVKSVKEITKDAYKGFAKATDAELITLANTTQGAVLQAVNGAASVELMTRVLDSTQLREIVRGSVIEGAKSSAWWKAQADDLVFKFQNVLQESIVRGDTTDEIARLVRGTKANNFTDGIMQTSFRHARSLVQSSVQNVHNAASIATYQANDDIFEGMEWLATLDSHTTQICRALDGLIWDFEFNPIGHKQKWPGKTAHWGCRSRQVPVLKGYSSLPPSKQKLMASERASLDGQVSDTIDYNEWLKKKDKTNPSLVKDILGKKKYEIWKEKGLSMRDMVDQFNNPLTAEQLAAKYN